MIQLRKAADRGCFDHGWLQTCHTFSFGDYDDPAQRGFRSLRVINEDRVAPGQGFGMHGHREMEIITLVLEGTLEHQDSLGNGSLIRPGELQRMSAGTGIRHSEFNPSESQWVHLYQIWLLPNRPGVMPSYEQRAFEPGEQHGRLRLVASPDGADGSLSIYQDARLYIASLAAEQTVAHALERGRAAWLQVLSGDVQVLGHSAAAGDGLALVEESAIEAHAATAAEILLFDLK